MEPIKTYEMPRTPEKQAFQLYEVQGKTIANPHYPHETDRPHRHKYYEVCVFVTGAGKHEIDFNTHQIQPNSIHFLSPGQVHLISREEDYHGYLMVFSKEFYSLDTFHEDLLFQLAFFNNPHRVPILNLDAGNFGELLDLIGLMGRELQQKGAYHNGILRSYLQVFLLKCQQHYVDFFAEKQKMGDPHYALAQQFQTLVEQQFKRQHLVQYYADHLALSPALLNKYVKKITGTTAGDLIIERLILQAKRYLIYTDLTNKEIAYQLNYADPSYFSRIFKKKTGLSPSEFRQAENEKYQK
ncbi:putative transcriptional regulator [Lunatimonas lonarensis]|uniref:Putative transcriptional regulator n=1 Tax=Lunatimonas lonarensis TaxID=1232681 RepID=R7ZVU1_9BACT|nr:AraC family transcriptional regulator [Lunatimonas lonarensis]EON78104.1 putative transcriptional regulator [Lunatimonas lonarensis]